MKFTAIVDKKYTKWDRLTIELDAQNENEVKGLIEKYDGLPPNAEILDTETLYEIDEAMTREENGGFEVYELMKIEVDKQ